MRGSRACSSPTIVAALGNDTLTGTEGPDVVTGYLGAGRGGSANGGTGPTVPLDG